MNCTLNFLRSRLDYIFLRKINQKRKLSKLSRIYKVDLDLYKSGPEFRSKSR